jgi:iron complex transport system ATP-binding protein
VAAGQMPYTNAFHVLKPENDVAIDLAMRRAQVTDFAHMLVHELSDGMRQKTMIARALAQQTDVLLLDEPTAFLDYASRHQLFTLLGALAREEKRCVIISTHDLDLVLRYCHKVLVMDSDGGVLMPVSEARNNARFMAIAGGFL